MCELIVDVAVENGTFTGNGNDDVPVTCESGRVILAASAYTGFTNSAADAVAVALADGVLSDTCTVAVTAAVQVSYSLTTGRVATL